MPFGETSPNANPGSLGDFSFNQRFPGQYFDQETGLHQNWHREYDPRIGRFVQADPVGLSGGPNVFAYSNSSPTKFVDPKGLTAGEFDSCFNTCMEGQFAAIGASYDNFRMTFGAVLGLATVLASPSTLFAPNSAWATSVGLGTAIGGAAAGGYASIFTSSRSLLRRCVRIGALAGSGVTQGLALSAAALGGYYLGSGATCTGNCFAYID